MDEIGWLQDGGSNKPGDMWMFDDGMKMNDFSKKNRHGVVYRVIFTR